MRSLFILLMVSLAFTACKQNNASTSTTASSTPKTEEPAATKKYTLTPFTSSQAYPDAKMESMDYTDGKFSFGVTGTNYKLGEQTPDAPQKMCANSGKGQHIHLIVNDAPYAAKYVADFDHDVKDGENYMLAFLSRSYHESIKTDDAYAAQKVTVANKSITERDIITEPMIFYSRPKGTYVGKKDTEKVMLDFYVVNGAMVPNYKVKVEINGEDHMVDKWQPYYIEGLEMGENNVKLTLLDGGGNAVKAPLNPVNRTFTLKADPVEG